MNIWNFIAMLPMVITITSAEKWKTVKRHQGWNASFADGNALDGLFESTVQDRILCVWECFNNSSCYAVAYRSDDLSCRMYDKVFTLMYNKEMVDEISIFEQQNVTLVWDTTSSLDIWTFDAASRICKLLDLQLMTYDQLNQTRGDYHSSECGYIDEGAVSLQDGGIVSCTLTEARAFCGEYEIETFNILFF